MKAKYFLLAALAALLASLVGGSAVMAAGGKSPGRHAYAFSGELLAAPAANASSVSLKVETGDRLALEKLLGQSQNESFSVDSKTEYLMWSKGIPTVVSSDKLHEGDWVTIRVHAARSATLAEIEATPAGIVADRGENPKFAHKPLWLFRGTLNSATSTSISLHVRGGNRRALHALLGQSLDQTFATDSGTIYLLWQGKVPSVIDWSRLKSGEKITVRIRAPRGSSLGQLESTPANHVGEHEPATA